MSKRGSGGSRKRGSAKNRSKHPAGSDYTVGYGKPPQEHRFKPGQSGNPNGRPRGAKSVDQVFREVVDQQVDIKVRGATRRVSIFEAVFHKTAEAALQGNLRAMQILLDHSDYLNDHTTISEAPSDQEVIDAWLLRRVKKGESDGLS